MQKLKGSFIPGVVFAKVCEFLLVPVEGFGVGSRGGGGGDFPVEDEGKGRGVGRVGRVGGVGTGKRTNARARLSKLPFSNRPFSFPLGSSGKITSVDRLG